MQEYAIDPQKIPIKNIYTLLTQLVIPRPIALISTLYNGQSNLAPFSFFNAVASNPPTIMVSIANKRNGKKKDTLYNIEQTQVFTVNFAHASLASAVTKASQEWDYGINEADISQLTCIATQKISGFRLKESLAHLECKVSHCIPIGLPDQPGSVTCILAEVVLFCFDKALLQSDYLDIFNPLARVGNKGYYTLGAFIPEDANKAFQS